MGLFFNVLLSNNDYKAIFLVSLYYFFSEIKEERKEERELEIKRLNTRGSFFFFLSSVPFPLLFVLLAIRSLHGNTGGEELLCRLGTVRTPVVQLTEQLQSQ